MNIIQPNLKFNGEFTFSNVPDTIILHHAEASHCTVKDIHAWHLSNGWLGIGYHYFCNKQGQVYKGRPDNAQGAHCLGYNDRSIGICAEGAYMTETMPEAQKQAVVELCRYLGIKSIKGHGEFYSTNCPGANYPLSEIKSLSLSIEHPYATYYLSYNPNHYDRNVVLLQQKLGIKADGYFGPMTKKAVIDFQRANGLDPDGIVGPLTWAKLG